MNPTPSRPINLMPGRPYESDAARYAAGYAVDAISKIKGASSGPIYTTCRRDDVHMVKDADRNPLNKRQNYIEVLLRGRNYSKSL